MGTAQLEKARIAEIKRYFPDASAYARQRPRSERSESYLPGRALEISREVFGSISKGRMESALKYKISDSEYYRLRERAIVLGSHLIEATRTSPALGFEGSYDKARDYYMSIAGRPLRFHDTIHALAAHRLWMTLAPRVFTAPSFIGDLQFVQEEVHAVVLQTFELFCKDAKNFDQAWRAFHKHHRVRFTEISARVDSYRENKNIIQAFIQAPSIMKSIWRQVEKRPPTETKILAKKIFTAVKRGETRVSLSVYLSESRDIEPVR